MSYREQYGIVSIRSRALFSILLIALLTVSFVFFFSKNNRDISDLNEVNLRVANLTDTLKAIVVSAERLRKPDSSSDEEDQLKRLQSLDIEFESNLLRLRTSVRQLDSKILDELSKISDLNGDPMWMYKDFQYRVQELLKIHNEYLPNKITKFVDFKGEVRFFMASMPYKGAVDRILAVYTQLILQFDPEQTMYLSQRLGQASDGIKTNTMLFMIIGGTLLTLIYFLIYLPMEGMISKQIRKLEVATVEVKKAAKVKSEFLANMSHEIRTPMNGVMGMTELLLKTKLDDRQKAFSDIIMHSGTSLLGTINNILDFSKIDSGQLELYEAPFVLNQIIEDTASHVFSKVAEKDIDLTVNVQQDLPRKFVGDEARIGQVLFNLLSNAVKFTENGAINVKVTGEVTNDVGYLKFSVSDTGIGIKPNKCEHIFEKFSQADESATRKYDGAGLGLAICASLVRLMGGEIRVRSKLGKGSMFYFKIALPVYEIAEKQIEIRVEPQMIKNVEGTRILIVDEHMQSSKKIKEQLKLWKFDVASVRSMQEAIHVMNVMNQQDIQIHGVLVDFQSASQRAKQFILAMRSNARLVDIPIVALTSVDHLEDGKSLRSLGIQAHLIKPLEFNALHNTLIKVVDEFLKSSHETKRGIAMVRALTGKVELQKEEADDTYIHIDQDEIARDIIKAKQASRRNMLTKRHVEQTKQTAILELYETRQQSA